MSQPILDVQHIDKQFGNTPILNNVSLQIHAGEVVSIVGASGAGKSTLLHIMGSLLRPDNGTVHIDGHDMYALKDKALSRLRNQQIGFVFQAHHLLPEFTAFENIMMPTYIGRHSKQSVSKAEELIRLLGIDHRKQHKPSELSGGEQQRVAVARALVNNPSIVFADEPSGNLDSHNAQELHQLFFQLNKELGQTLVIVTHNELLADMSHRKLVMEDGEMIHDYSIEKN